MGSSSQAARDLGKLLEGDAVEVRWHRYAGGLVREPAADAIVLATADLLDATAAIRRVTAAKLIAVGGDDHVAATCLALGADAWLPEGVAMKILAAQLRSMLRSGHGERRVQVLEAGHVRMDVAARRATVRGHELSLKPREFDLLQVFVENQGTVLSRDRILAGAWGTRFVGEPKTVDVHIAWLRPKLEGSGLRVTTLRGVGYRLDVLEATARPSDVPPAKTGFEIRPKVRIL